MTEALNRPYAVIAARVTVCTFGLAEINLLNLAEVNLLFNFQRILLEKFTTGDTLVVLVLEALTALEGSEAWGPFLPQEEKGQCLRIPVKTISNGVEDLSLRKTTGCQKRPDLT